MAVDSANHASMPLRTEDLEYELPHELIAVRPVDRRDDARLLVLRRYEPGVLADAHVRDLPELLQPGDLLIVNDTRVLPARFHTRRADTAGRVEGLFLEQAGPGEWRVLLRSNGRLRPGVSLVVVSRSGGQSETVLRLLHREADAWRVAVEPMEPADAILERHGQTPLPPYIRRARTDAGLEVSDEDDRRHYQTVYADAAHTGAVAAPTAGLHFTDDLRRRLMQSGVLMQSLTLYVGAGTFKPVETEYVEDHPIHEERYEVSTEALSALRMARAEGRRIIAVGTTSLRALESLPDTLPEATHRAATRLLITPGYTFRWVDGLMTNFHQPRSTLLALVAAFHGLEQTLAAYHHAVRERYRFHSYGDAMVLLP